MKFHITAVATCLICLVATSFFPGFSHVWADGDPDSLAADLWYIRSLRTGKVLTDFTELDQRVAEVIAKHDDPNAQGQIYLEALLVHAMSGLAKADQAIHYAEKAEKLLSTPASVAQLYLSWGDALQLSDKGASSERREEIRRQAAQRYLQSMKVALDNNMPKVLPDKPKLPKGAGFGGRVIITIPEGISPEAAARLRAEQEKWEAQRRAQAKYLEELEICKQQKAILDRCNYARDLIVSIYQKTPGDTPELEQIAMEVLGDRESVEDLLQRVKPRLKD